MLKKSFENPRIENSTMMLVRRGDYIDMNEDFVPPGNINELVGEGWNAGGTDSKGANYAVFDLRKDMHIIGFAVYSAGDVTHDPNEIQIHTSSSASGPWNTVVTVNGKAGADGLRQRPTSDRHAIL